MKQFIYTTFTMCFCALIFGLGVIACDDDDTILSGFSKARQEVFLNNQTGQDVVVSWSAFGNVSSFEVKAGEATEITGYDLWDLDHHGATEVGDVYFRFADGTEMVHHCYNQIDEAGTEVKLFLPTVNNIFDIDGSWTKTRLGNNVTRDDYFIKK